MEHGGDVYTEGILKGRKILDFSSNINPLGVPESFHKAMKHAVEAVERYPDVLYRNLRDAIKEYVAFSGEYFFKEKKHISIEHDNIVLGNGAAEVIDTAVSCFKSICIPVPSFIEYEKSALKFGCEIYHSNLKEDMSYDYKNIESIMENAEALIIANPNNPNGGVINKEEFTHILDFCEKNNKTIIVDEAFIEFTGKEGFSLMDLMDKYSCLFIIKALTKFFAVPGIRMGYGISKNQQLVNAIEKKQNPWNVNCFAEYAAIYMLKDKEYIKRSLQWIKEERVFMESQLSNIDLIEKVYKTHSNFILCKLKNISCEELYEKCMSKDLAIRKCSNFKGFNSSYIRLAIKNRESNNALIEILNLF